MNNHKTFLICLLAFIILILACDGGSRVGGNVYDSENKPIENADVKFEQIEKGEPPAAYQCMTKTDKEGRFGCSFTHAPWKVELKLTVSKKDYKTYEMQLSSGETREVANGSGYKIILEKEN